MYVAYSTIGAKSNAYDNREIVKRTVNTRLRLANLLGYSTYSDYVLAERMAQNSDAVVAMLGKLTWAYMPAAKKEVSEIIALAKELEGNDFEFMPWDFAYYSEKLKERKKEEERKKVNTDTKQKMKEGTEESSLVVEGGEVIDVVDLINNMENSVIAVRLKTLFENGISESMIESRYQELSSGVTNMQTALDNMRTVCDLLLQYLSDIPNGIIINMTTGEVDVKKSLESAVECGILRPDDILIVDPFKEKFELAPKETFVETIMNSKIFSTEEKKDFLSDYNKFLRTNYSLGSISHSKSRKEDEKLDKESEDFLTIEIGETKEEQKRQNEKRDYYKMDTVEDMSFMQMVVFFAKKDVRRRVVYPFIRGAFLRVDVRKALQRSKRPTIIPNGQSKPYHIIEFARFGIKVCNLHIEDKYNCM